VADVARQFPGMEGTHRQNPQQRSLASILQADHGDVHLGGPAKKSGQQSGFDIGEEVLLFAGVGK
jgi:hypothetical protein